MYITAQYLATFDGQGTKRQRRELQSDRTEQISGPGSGKRTLTTRQLKETAASAGNGRVRSVVGGNVTSSSCARGRGTRGLHFERRRVTGALPRALSVSPQEGKEQNWNPRVFSFR